MSDDAMSDDAYDKDGACPWWGQALPSLDLFNDGTYHCSHCGRATVVIDGERHHRPPEAAS